MWLVPNATLTTSLSRSGDPVCWNAIALSTWRLLILLGFTEPLSSAVVAVFEENRNDERMSEVFERSDWSI